MRALTVILFLCGSAAAQPPAADTARLLGQSDATAKRLAEVGKAVEAGKPDALDQLLKLVDEAGDDLIAADGRQFRPARRQAQRLLVKLPPAALRSYRDRVAGPADALLAAGVRDRDPRPLRTLLDRYFPAAASEPALLLLGELLFERGEFREAEAHWRRLLPSEDATADPSLPTPVADPPRARALVALAVLFQGDLTRALAEVESLRTDHPKAAGKLAGVDGPYADTLAKLLADPPRRPPPTGGGDWTGFAGNPARDGRATGRLPRYWPTRPTWSLNLPPLGEPPAVARTPTARSVAYHPVVQAGMGYVADPLRVFAFDLLTGTGRLAFDLRNDNRFAGLPVDAGTPTPTADADFTLTAAAGNLYGRFGRFPPATAPDVANRPGDFLVSLSPSGGKLGVRWAVPPPARDGAVVAWEAAPVVLDGRVYAAFTRVDGVTRTYAVAAHTDPPGDKPVWVAEVATAPAGVAPRVRQEPLTVAGGRLVYCTHAGSVVALDPATGKVAWAVKYPAPRRPSPAARDLCPPLAAGGRVFVAPLDSDVLLALDAATGRVLWSADGLVVDQLVGVSRGRLVATIAGPQKGIRGFDAATGRDTEPAGWRQHDDPQLGSFGRGLVTDDLVLWPTKQGLYPLSLDTGRLVTQPLPGTHGNLAFADGVLLVGGPFGVAGFVPDRLVPESSPRARAVALADDGKVDEAVRLARSAGLPDAERLADWWRLPPTLPAPVPRPLTIPPPRFDPAALIPLGPAVRVSAVTRFPVPVAPLRPFDDGPGLPGLDGPNPLLVVTDGPRVLAYRPGESQPVWATPLPVGLRVNRGLAASTDILAAGPSAVVRLDRADGRLLWAYCPSLTSDAPRPSRPPLPPTLTDFVAVGTRLCCRLGGRLIALDLADGRPVWTHDGLFLRPHPFPLPSAPGFTDLSCPDGQRLLARRRDGKLFVLDPQTGDLLSSAGTALVPWDGPPVRIDADRVVVADGPDRVTALDPGQRRPGWGAMVGGEYGSLWGRSPQLRVAGDGLLLGVARSHGSELECVRKADGARSPGWPRDPIFLSTGPIDLHAADADAAAVYVPDGSDLTAVRLADGLVAWRTPLPGRWRVRCGSRAVLLTPDAAVAPDADAGSVVGRFARHPHAGRLPVLLIGLYDAWVGRTVPVLALDPATGRPLGRLDLPAAGPACGVHLGPGPAVVVTGLAAHWLN